MEKFSEDFLSHEADYLLNQANNQTINEEILDRLQKEFNEIDRKLTFDNDNGRIVFIGYSGSGKTSIISYLNQETLIGKENDEEDVILFNPETESKPKIGNSYQEMTTVPTIIYQEDQTLVDFPGLIDYRGVDQEIKNLYSIYKVFESSKKIKVVLVIDASSLNECRATRLFKIFNFIGETFPNKEVLFKSLSLVVTK